MPFKLMLHGGPAPRLMYGLVKIHMKKTYRPSNVEKLMGCRKQNVSCTKTGTHRERGKKWKQR